MRRAFHSEHPRRSPHFMRADVNRRHFLGGSLTALGGIAASTRITRGMEPLSRAGSHFKFSLAAYSYRRLLQGRGDAAPQLTLHDFIDDCASFGLDGTELTSYYFPSEINSASLYDLKRHCFRQGLDVSGTAVGNDFGHRDDSAREQQIAHVKQWVEHAAKLDAPVIRIFAGHVHGNEDPEEVHKRMVAGIEECCEVAGQHGVHLALENHGGPTATAEGLLQLVRDVSSPWFGVNLDTGNFRSPDPYADLRATAAYAINVQVKVVMGNGSGGRSPTDFRRVAEILREANYRGYVVLEFEEDGDPRSECPRYLDQLRDAFAQA